MHVYVYLCDYESVYANLCVCLYVIFSVPVSLGIHLGSLFLCIISVYVGVGLYGDYILAYWDR